jgi:hypothetical protein
MTGQPFDKPLNASTYLLAVIFRLSTLMKLAIRLRVEKCYF